MERVTLDVAHNPIEPRRPIRPSSRWLPSLLATLVVVVLSLPVMRFAYVFDDYDFLGRAQLPNWSHLLPNPNDTFYRPVSREAYFGVLERVSPGNPTLGHVANLLCVVLIVVLTGALTAHFAGQPAGVAAALLVAAFSQWPVLVGWVCGSQDLFAIFFLLLAIRVALDGAGLDATVAFVLAVLSKETAIVTAPAVVAAAWLSGAPRRTVFKVAATCGGVILVWGLVHPGFRALVEHGGRSLERSYIGLDNPGRLSALRQSLPTLLNLPLTGNPTPWPRHLELVLGVAFALVMASVVAVARVAPQVGSSGGPAAWKGWQIRKADLLGILVGLPPLALTVLFVKHWVPYYTCFSLVGLAMILAPRVAKLPGWGLAAVLACYLILGVWSRGVILKPGLPTEQGLEPAGQALRLLEANFKKVAPTLQPGTTVYVTTMARGERSVYLHLHYFQALRVWYREPTIETLRPELKVATGGPEALFWVDPDLNVFRVDLRTLQVTSSGPVPEWFRRRSTLRSYAIGLANSGDLQRAFDILVHLDPPASWEHALSYRMAAMLIYAAGDSSTADDLMNGVPPFPRETAVSAVRSMLVIPTLPGRPLEQAAFRAFGLSWEDEDAIRELMRGLSALGYFDTAGRLAQRLIARSPADREAKEVLARAVAARRGGAQIIPPIRQFEFPGP